MQPQSKLGGLIRLGFLVVDAEGTFVTAEGSSQVAFENNGGLFDESAVEYEWKNPMVFSNSEKTLECRSNWLYFYIGNDEWDCIDLIKLATCK